MVTHIIAFLLRSFWPTHHGPDPGREHAGSKDLQIPALTLPLLLCDLSISLNFSVSPFPGICDK
jgi:hypothetical protein